MSEVEKPKVSDGKEQEKRDVAGRVKSALSALQNSIKSPSEDTETQNGPAKELIMALIEAGKLGIIAEGKINDPELIALTTAITEDQGTQLNTKGLINALSETENANNSLGQLADEISAVDKYLSQPAGKVTLEEKAVALNERIKKFVTDKLPANAIKELAGKFKMDMKPEQIENIRKFITNMITMTIAGAIEKFPGMGKIAGDLRWGIVLSQAKAPDSGLTAEQKKQLDNPEKLGQIKNDWTRNYMSWLSRKKVGGNQFAEGVPTVANVLAQRAYVAKQETEKDASQKKLFGIDGLKQNEEFEITKETRIQIGGKEVKISKDAITVDGIRKTLTGSKLESLKILTSSQTPTDLSIRFKVGNTTVERKLNADIVQKFSDTKITLNKDPDLILEPLKT